MWEFFKTWILTHTVLGYKYTISKLIWISPSINQGCLATGANVCTAVYVRFLYTFSHKPDINRCSLLQQQRARFVRPSFRFVFVTVYSTNVQFNWNPAGLCLCVFVCVFVCVCVCVCVCLVWKLELVSIISFHSSTL